MRCLVFFICACGATPVIEEGRLVLESDALCAWKKTGPVTGVQEGVLAPAILRRGEMLHLWFAQKNGIEYTSFHAVSTDDGLTFSDVQKTDGLEQYAHVTWTGKFDAISGSGSLKSSRSDDGVHFTTGETVLTPSFVGGRFDALSLLYPSRVDNVLFFSAFNGQHISIGRAVDFSVSPTVPVLEASEGWDNTAVAQPNVHHTAQGWSMYYGGYDTRVSNPGPYRIGYATSIDGIHWSRRGIAIELGETSDAWSTRDPAVSGHTMIYVGLGADNVYRLHRATDNCQ